MMVAPHLQDRCVLGALPRFAPTEAVAHHDQVLGIGGDLVQDLGKDGALLVAVPRQALCPLLVAVVACKGVVDLSE